MTFTESNTVEALVRDILCGGVTHHTAVGPGLAQRHGALSGLGWHYLGLRQLPRQAHEILVEDHVREALIRLNPEIAAQPDRADDVLYRLRAILMGVRTDGLVKANEEFAAWLAGERSMPFGADGEHVTVRLVDLEDVERNQYVVSTQYTVRSGANERRADLVLLVNGLPLIVIEAKTPVRSSQSWFDGATQIHDDYERNVPELFVPNLCSVATEGKDLRYGSIGLPVDLWGPWRADHDAGAPKLERVKRTVSSMLRPSTVLDLLGSYTAYATGKGRRRAKIVARYQQVEAANRIVERVVAGHPKKGLVWHFQGSGKSLLMLFAAQAAAASGVGEPDGDHRGRPHRPRHADIQHLPRGRRAELGEGRQPGGSRTVARAGRPQDHHHDDFQVRRGRRCPERPSQHHRAGR